MSKDSAASFDQKKWEYTIGKITDYEKRIETYKKARSGAVIQKVIEAYDKLINYYEGRMCELKAQYPGKF